MDLRIQPQISPGAGFVPSMGGPRPGTLRFEAPAPGGNLDDQLDLQGPLNGSLKCWRDCNYTVTPFCKSQERGFWFWLKENVGRI